MPFIPSSDHIPDKLFPLITPFLKIVSTILPTFTYTTSVLNEYGNDQVTIWGGCRSLGGISPDFRLYHDLPLGMQLWNTVRGRALGHWLARNGVEVIPNTCWSDERSYAFCFDGIQPEKSVAVGTHGCIQHREISSIFKKGWRGPTRRRLLSIE